MVHSQAQFTQIGSLPELVAMWSTQSFCRETHCTKRKKPQFQPASHFIEDRDLIKKYKKHIVKFTTCQHASGYIASSSDLEPSNMQSSNSCRHMRTTTMTTRTLTTMRTASIP
eukprot:5582003-Amphidinium_carterae.1